MTLNIRYFASLRDEMGRSQDALDAAVANQVSGIIAHLKDRDEKGWVLAEPFVRIIVNGVVAHAETPVADGDEIAFCPPFSGG
ncbi:MoaD/ThiS family protein [Maricaulis sp.]|uniref:MoaD/ThiS family protein n=1 Tax=Maricaulis sp. TaxID=1486257 RepID=UPI00260D5399|nr:MoaD/ThiS family protein [Maricaulis sp.]